MVRVIPAILLCAMVMLTLHLSFLSVQKGAAFSSDPETGLLRSLADSDQQTTPADSYEDDDWNEWTISTNRRRGKGIVRRRRR